MKKALEEELPRSPDIMGAEEEEIHPPFGDQVPSLLPFGFPEDDMPDRWPHPTFPAWVYYSALVPSE